MQKMLSRLILILIFSFCFATALAKDHKMIFEIIIPKTIEKTVDFGFVTSQLSRGLSVSQIKTEGDKSVVLSGEVLVFKDKRYAIIASIPSELSKVFPLSVDLSKTEWTEWQKPTYVINEKDASWNFMNDILKNREKPSIKDNQVSLRFRIESFDLKAKNK